MTELSNKPAHGQDKQPPTDEAAVSGNPPVQPVEDFNPGNVDEDRRIFQNGDTDREADDGSTEG